MQGCCLPFCIQEKYHDFYKNNVVLCFISSEEKGIGALYIFRSKFEITNAKLKFYVDAFICSNMQGGGTDLY